MYDSVTLDAIPADAEAVAGYVGGRWPTFKEIPGRWPKAKHLSIAVSAEQDADCLDIENGDATPAQAPVWFRRQKTKKPVLYCAVSNARTVLGVMTAAGIPRTRYHLWTAHYTGTPHRCTSNCGFGFGFTADATQYTDKALGRNLDCSLVSDSFFDPGLPAALRRKALRAWIIARHAQGWTWARLKKTANWKKWWGLGGR